MLKKLFKTRLPEAIELRALLQSFEVRYLPTRETSRIPLIENANQQLTFLGNPKPTVVYPALTDWLVKKAKMHLSAWIQRLSIEKNLPFTGLSIRQQKTLWGSCTAEKRISLNCKLLFLPTTLAEHVLLHELCHTTHFDHSRAFWTLLGALDPYCREHRKQLKTAHTFVPPWLKMG